MIFASQAAGPLRLLPSSLAEADGSCVTIADDWTTQDSMPGFRIEGSQDPAGHHLALGLIISEVAGVTWPVGSVQPNQITISDDRYIPGLEALSELAEFLLERGDTVTLVDDALRRPCVGATHALAERVEGAWRRPIPRCKGYRLGTDAVRFTDKDGADRAIGADGVVAAKGVTANPAVVDTLRQAGFTVHAFGDCVGIGYIEGAIRGAANVIASLAQVPAALQNVVH